MLPQKAQDIPGAFQGNGHVAVFLLDFIVRTFRGGIIRHGGGHEDEIRLGSVFRDGIIHILSGHHGNGAQEGRRFDGRGAGDQGDIRSPEHGHFGKGVAHFAGGVVRQIPHRVNGLLGGAGADKYPLARKVVGKRQMTQDVLQ